MKNTLRNEVKIKMEVDSEKYCIFVSWHPEEHLPLLILLSPSAPLIISLSLCFLSLCHSFTFLLTLPPFLSH